MGAKYGAPGLPPAQAARDDGAVPPAKPAPADARADGPSRAFMAALRATLAAHADAARAAPMQAYMKSALPFRGVATPLRRKLVVAAVAAHPAAGTAALGATMRALWREAAFREERYAAVELARVGPHGRWLSLDLLPVFEEMLTTGAWWDFCDDISGNALPRLLEQHAGEMKPLLRRWATGGNLWLRRAAILSQRRLGPAGFDATLLYDTILPSIGSGRFAGEFFIRKGIGWALRERSYAAPAEVVAFCAEYAEQLSPLTQREALKVVARRAAQAGD